MWAPQLALAQNPPTSGSGLPNPVVMVIILGGLALAPFVLIMLTSFVKISVVLSILRNALGTQAVPPNQVITGLAFILSLFIMTPVARNMYQEAGAIGNTRDIFSEASVKNIFEALDRGKEPLRRFLAKHAHPQDRVLFMNLGARLEQGNKSSTSPPANVPGPGKDYFQVLIPAFVTSQLKEAFEAGFLIFLPFIVIDMVVANVLLAMGMNMLSPSVISLPFKILLFVLVDGWFLVVRGLVLSYA
ncbi:MAG: type III secretion system export apparatus subunit SctR [Acidobacteriaceae bacterium]|nr:type III secretion system export apparatus subunit SctR [Acidobacteriaceae bacterium]MBV9294079.1 type III secretion system export apparatus subunit SctR [Acidobacteriaceae bacterium]MBV9764144.1 type III secretion system export apparatus subunit SctR [Acidobacteriaceae bacterium]